MNWITVAASGVALTTVADSYPSISHDGKMLAFHSNRSGKQAIWLADSDGKTPRLIYDGGKDGTDPGTPSWSPDGSTLVFSMRPADAPASDANESEIYLLTVVSRMVTRLTKAPGDDSHPHWSADGRRIFFNSARATPDLAADWSKQWIDIYSMARDGSDVRRHTDCRTVCTYPFPSPDGLSVVHRKVDNSPGRSWEQTVTARNSEVVVTRLADRTSVNISPSPSYDGWPVWSPDGKWVVFASNRDGVANVGQIYRVHPDGTGLERISEGPLSHAQPAVSADGKSIFVYQLSEAGGAEMGHIARIDLVSEATGVVR